MGVALTVKQDSRYNYPAFATFRHYLVQSGNIPLVHVICKPAELALDRIVAAADSVHKRIEQDIYSHAAYAQIVEVRKIVVNHEAAQSLLGLGLKRRGAAHGADLVGVTGMRAKSLGGAVHFHHSKTRQQSVIRRKAVTVYYPWHGYAETAAVNSFFLTEGAHLGRILPRRDFGNIIPAASIRPAFYCNFGISRCNT